MSHHCHITWGFVRIDNANQSTHIEFFPLQVQQHVDCFADLNIEALGSISLDDN